MTDVDADLAIIGAATVFRELGQDVKLTKAQAEVFKRLLRDADARTELLKETLRQRIKASQSGETT